MSHFYGMISQSARKTVPTARGHKTTGLHTCAAGWGGKITTRLYYCEDTDRDMFEVWMHPHHGEGDQLMLCAGEVGKKLTVEFDPLAELRSLSNEELLAKLEE